MATAAGGLSVAGRGRPRSCGRKTKHRGARSPHRPFPPGAPRRRPRAFVPKRCRESRGSPQPGARRADRGRSRCTPLMPAAGPGLGGLGNPPNPGHLRPGSFPGVGELLRPLPTLQPRPSGDPRGCCLRAGRRSRGRGERGFEVSRRISWDSESQGVMEQLRGSCSGLVPPADGGGAGLIRIYLEFTNIRKNAAICLG